MKTLALAVCLVAAATWTSARAQEPTTPAGEREAAASYRRALIAEAAGEREAARRAYEEVLRHDPDHLAARRALGYERVDGEWLRGEALLRAKGLVAAGDRVLTAEEVAARAAATVTPGDAPRTEEKAEPKPADPEPGSASHPVRALWSAKSEERVHAAQRLARIGDRRVAPALIERWSEGSGGMPPRAWFGVTKQTTYIQDFDVEVA